MAAPGSALIQTGVLGWTAGVEQGDIRLTQTSQNVVFISDRRRVAKPGLEKAGRWPADLVFESSAGGVPGVNAAVQHRQPFMAQHRQSPQQPARPTVAFLVIGDYGLFRRQTQPRQHFAQPRFGRQQAHGRRLHPHQVGVIQMNCAGDMAGGITGRIAQVDDQNAVIGQMRLQLIRFDQ